MMESDSMAISAIFWLTVVVAIGGLIKYIRLDTYIRGLISLLDLLFSVKRRARNVQTKNPEWTLSDIIEESCRRNWNRSFVVMAGHDDSKASAGRAEMKYGECEMASSAVAKYVSGSTIRCEPGDIVAIFMPSSCEFVVALFGLIRCGVQAALVNTGLRGNSLVHALTAALDEGNGSGIKAVLVSPDLKSVLESLVETGQVPPSLAIIECGPGCELDPWIETKRFAYLGRNHRKASRWDDTSLYIYTSGTTGLPKASKINHLRVWSAGCTGRKICQLKSSDRLYCPLPLYHASGLTLGLGACLQKGSTIVLRPKFSVRHFSQDILMYRCNGVQYIGEMARYLAAAPGNPLDAKVRLRFAWGNGMPREVWIPFQRRYNIYLVNEFYASTEGNVNIFNNTGMAPGACGIVPPGFGFIYPIGIFKYDMDTGDLIRDEKTGMCIPADWNEPGELLGLIKQDDPSRRFDGYTDDKASQKKVVTNVRKSGDSYFRSGDLLKQDRWGFLYFCDRVGETFRWKGENVSTSEVARALLASSGATRPESPFSEAVVYGVEVHGHPGRAGMATAVLGPTFEQSKWESSLWHSLQVELPRYAQPLFIRIANEIEKTPTQKYKKTKLQDESFLECGSDLVYFRDDAVKSYVLIDDAVRDEIVTGKRRI